MVLNIVLIVLGILFLILMIALVLNPPEALIKKVFAGGSKKGSSERP